MPYVNIQITAGATREQKAGLVRDVTDALHQFRVANVADANDHRVPRGPLAGVDPHLDQLVMIQRAADLGDQGVVEALATDDHHRLQGVSELAQPAALFFWQGHACGSWRMKRRTVYPMPRAMAAHGIQRGA